MVKPCEVDNIMLLKLVLTIFKAQFNKISKNYAEVILAACPNGQVTISFIENDSLG